MSELVWHRMDVNGIITHSLQIFNTGFDDKIELLSITFWRGKSHRTITLHMLSKQFLTQGGTLGVNTITNSRGRKWIEEPNVCEFWTCLVTVSFQSSSCVIIHDDDDDDDEAGFCFCLFGEYLLFTSHPISPLSLSLSLSHTHTHTRARARTRWAHLYFPVRNERRCTVQTVLPPPAWRSCAPQRWLSNCGPQIPWGGLTIKWGIM